MKDPLKKYIDNHREEFDQFDIPEDAFDKIMSHINKSETPEAKIHPLFSYKNWTVAASVAALLSLGLYTFWTDKETPKTLVVIENTQKTKPSNIVEPISSDRFSENIKSPKAQPESKLKVTKNSVVNASGKNRIANTTSDQHKQKRENKYPDQDQLNAVEMMNNQLSASTRLQGIEWVKNISDSDHTITNLLTEIALNDENTNVCLAAVDALYQNLNHTEMIAKMQQIFLQQNDPMVQKELMAIFAQKQNSELTPEVNAKLHSITQDPTSAAFVKDEAYAILMKF